MYFSIYNNNEVFFFSIQKIEIIIPTLWAIAKIREYICAWHVLQDEFEERVGVGQTNGLTARHT